MSASFGGLGLLSFHSPFPDSVGLIVAKTDLRSLFCLVIFSIVVLVLAYLTNPSENSFRAFLIEQSFRQHLTRLDVNADDENAAQDGSTSNYLSRRSSLAKTHALSLDKSPFHFANRASVSLRTPKHVFHSFGIFTIAAMAPLSRSSLGDDRDALIISDSWYIGAFGRWWRGGILDAWYQDIITRSTDEECWTSGILSMKNLDLLNEYNGLPFSTKNLPPHLLARGSPPKLRNRERSSPRSAILPARSSSPPPLPKSVSLPLHTARLPSSSAVDRSSALTTHPLLRSSSLSSSCPVDQVHLGSSALSRSPSTLFDQSPNIAEVLRQISVSKITAQDLRTQLTDYQASSLQSHTQLQNELDSLRDRKRQEDGSKLDTKSRTKTLDDSKRHTENMRKDAEKRLKAAQNARDGATQRMDHLDNEILKLQQCLSEDETLLRQSKETVSDAEQDISNALERKRNEIKVAEDVVSALNQRARELEESVAMAKENLARLKERNEMQRQGQTLRPAGQTPWDLVNGFSVAESEERRRRSLTGFEAISSLGRRRSVSRDTLAFSNHGTSALSTNSGYQTSNVTHSALRANGYSVFDDSILTAQQHPSRQSRQLSTNFSPFDDNDAPRNIASAILPPGQSLISSALATSLDSPNGVSRSFQSESDVYMDREWRGHNLSSLSHNGVRPNGHQSSGFASSGISPTSLHAPSSREYDHDPFEIRFMQKGDEYGRNGSQEVALDNQHNVWVHRTNPDLHSHQYMTEESDASSSMVVDKVSPRRWFSTTIKDKAKKGLNPEAKVFTLVRKPTPRTSVPGPTFKDVSSGNSTTMYDALNPNGLGSQTGSATTSANNSLLRAFAPSPAEREALQRALGGSSNTSFERLPSLSDVGSIPSSPSHVHDLPAVAPQQMGKVLPSWLQSLPRFRKANFSPWEDEEPVSVSGGSGAQGY